MNHNLFCLLASVCVVALIHQVHGDPTECDDEIVGTLAGTKYRLPEVNMAEGIRDWTVNIELPSTCINVNGVASKTCDADSAPKTYFKNKLVLIVHRTSHLTEKAPVQITVYCDE